ncbi:MAG TPA: PAS domain-containing protein [Alphaproteobacteria bacterium]|nr:PAS domain-containing protein [Alphaproteobacteria bacterium]
MTTSDERAVARDFRRRAHALRAAAADHSGAVERAYLALAAEHERQAERIEAALAPDDGERTNGGPPRDSWLGDRRWFDAAPHGYLLLSPALVIVDINATYARLTMTDRDAVVGRHMFEVFPDNPDNPAADGVTSLSASLGRVLAHKRRDQMSWQRYDVRDPGGEFVERHWSPVNVPILDANGDVEYILHAVDDVTVAAVHLRKIR